MTHAEQLMFAWWGFVSEVVGMVTGVGAVVVAVAFGLLTLRATRTANDASERATIASTDEGGLSNGDLVRLGRMVAAQSASGRTEYRGDTRSGTWAGGPPASPITQVRWRLEHRGGVVWDLWNDGDATAFGVTLDGLTTQDKQRITAEAPDPVDVEPDNQVSFRLFTAWGMSGAATIVIGWSATGSGPRESKRMAVVGK